MKMTKDKTNIHNWGHDCYTLEDLVTNIYIEYIKVGSKIKLGKLGAHCGMVICALQHKPLKWNFIECEIVFHYGMSQHMS